MRSLKNLDIEKSIETKRLTYDEKVYDKVDTLTNYLVFLILIFLGIFGLKNFTSSANSDFEYFIYFCLGIFGLYGFYCTFTEKHLREIKFNIHKEEAKRRIIEYGKKYNYRISKISNNLIFLNEPTDNFSFGNYERTTIIFFKEQSILYTLISEGAKLNSTVLISQHLVKMDLKRILNPTKLKKAKKRSYFNMFFNGPY